MCDAYHILIPKLGRFLLRGHQKYLQDTTLLTNLGFELPGSVERYGLVTEYSVVSRSVLLTPYLSRPMYTVVDS